MSTIIGGSSPSVTFPDSTVQDTSAIVGGKVPYANLPAGCVLQVVSAVYSTTTSTTSSLVDTGLTATITPKFSTSKILVLVGQSIYMYNGGNDNGAILNLVRGSTTIFSSSSGQAMYIYCGSGSTEMQTSYPVNYLDSPATTSATTYKMQMQGVVGATIQAQSGSVSSSITLMEIAA